MYIEQILIFLKLFIAVKIGSNWARLVIHDVNVVIVNRYGIFYKDV